MALALNDSGDAVYYDGKAWKPAPVATNAQGQKLFYDGSAWISPNPNALLKKGQPKIPTAEEEALQPVAEDPIAEMQKHPYATAALTGAVMGPTFGLPAAVGAIPGAGAAAGAAEQMAYQKAADVGQKIAGPEHPILGMLPGVLAPAISPAMTAAGGGRLAVRAATEAEMQATAERQAQNTAEQHLAMTAPQAAELAKPQINPTPGQPPSPQFAQQAQQLQQAKQAMWQSRRDALHTVGRQYDPIFQAVDEMPLTPEHTDSIQQGVADARNTMAARGRSFTPATNKLLDEIAPTAPAGKAYDTAESIRAKEGETGPQPGAAPSVADSMRAKRELSDNLYKTKGGDYVAPPIEEKQTVGQLRGKLARLRQAADAPGMSAVERSAIFDASKPIIKVLDSVIPDEQKPILASINAQYAQVNKILPFKNMRAMNAAGTLPELGEAVFGKGNEAATSMALAHMNPQQKGLMRDAFASWALSQKGTGKELFNLLSSQQDHLAQLGFPPELSSVGRWNELVTGANKMEKVPGLPAQKQFADGVRQSLREAGYSKEALQSADEALRKSAGGHMPWYVRYPLIYAPVEAMLGFGLYAHEPALGAAAVAFGIPYFGKRIVANTSLLPMYRQFVMDGWTRGGGVQFGKLLVAATRNTIQTAVREQGARPDKEREREAMSP